jgi:hypothetical protein
MTDEAQRNRVAVIKTEEGKFRTSTGRWSTAAMADHVAKNPDRRHDYRTLSRVAFGDALPYHAAMARSHIRDLANFLENRGTLVVVEFVNRKIHAIQVFDWEDEYHQRLMDSEIGRRKVRADGSHVRLEHLLMALPQAARPLTETEDGANGASLPN